MNIRQTVHITLSDEPPKIIDGYWYEWVNGEWVNTGIKAEGGDGITFMLSNPSISLKKDSSGNIISYSAAKGELVVLKGNVKINDYSDVVFYSPVNNNCVVTMDRWGRYEVVSVNTNSNNIYSDLKASYKGLVVESRLNIQVVADGVSPALRYRRSFEEPNTPTGNAVGWHQSPDIPVVTESVSDTWELEDGFFVSPPVSIVDDEIEIDYTHTKISFTTTVPNQSVFIHLKINGPGILLLGHLDGFNPSLYNYRERLISAGQEIVVCVDVPASGSHHIYTSLHYNKQDLGAKVRLTNTNTVWVTQQNPTTKAWSKPIKFTQDNSDNESVFLLSSTEEQPAQPESEKYTDDYIPRLGINKNSIKDWSVNKPYAAHEIALFNGAYKQALQAHSGIEPTNTAYWKDYYFWTDDPSPLTATAKYQYIATRDKDNGLWGNYSTPRLWAKYGEDGANGKDGANYLIFGFFSDKIQYKLSPAGIPVIKIEDSTQAGFSVHKLIAPQSTFNVATQKGTFVPSEWELVESIDFIYMQEAYIEHLQAVLITAEHISSILIKTGNLEVLSGAKIAGLNIYDNAIASYQNPFGVIPPGEHIHISRTGVRIDKNVGMSGNQVITRVETSHDRVEVHRMDSTGNRSMEVRVDGIYRDGVKIL